MSRLTSSTLVQPTAAQLDNLGLLNAIFAQSEEDVEIEQKFVTQTQQLLEDFPAATWDLAFVDVAGSGHGQQFTVWGDVVDGAVVGRSGVLGLDLSAPFIVVYIADTPQAVDAARARAITRYIARITALGQTINQLRVRATWMCGASKGNRVMGVEFITPEE